MPLKNLSVLPPGGFKYFQKETGAEFNDLCDFDTMVAKIIAHRQGNPGLGLSTDWATVADELEEYTCARLKWDPMFCYGGPKKATAQSSNNNPQHDCADTVAGVADKIRHIRSGAKILAWWVGAGMMPVSPETARKRAAICAECPHNKKPGAFDSALSFLADTIRKQLTLKRSIGLTTDFDDRLHTCTICSCHLPLKIWVPLKTIMRGTAPEELRRLPDHCWIKPGL